jgi:molecular chaperone HtpG
MAKGNISVQTENIFPIIKQFLYSDQEIFLRELVSNAVDATVKLKTLASKNIVTGEIGDITIEILLDEANGTLTIRDKGIGMNEAEAQQYLNQVAFSSAQEFLDKYQGEANIIGHFGLGFYSAFMVAKRVEVVTKTWQENFSAVRWACDGNPEYELDNVEKEARGTDVILHISDDAKEYLEKNKIEELLNKYCKFLPVPIQFGTKTVYETEGEGDNEKTTPKEVVNIINNPNPIWKKTPAELTDADYQDFYQSLYPMSAPPLFWIHLNVDYPFNLTGILYFPKLSNNMEIQRNKIQLYSNQVFVTDDVKEIVPEFLMMLHGVIDSPDIPLNVSRSYLQSDREVKKITSYITRKVADKLNDIFKNQREEYEAKWRDIGMFVKYGMLTEEAFYDKAIKFALLNNVDNQCFTIDDYIEKIKPTQTNKHDQQVVLYAVNIDAQDGFVKAAKQRGYDVLNMPDMIDNHFMQKLEQKLSSVTFKRVDADTVNKLIEKEESLASVMSEEEQTAVKTIFEGISPSQNATVQLEALSPEDAPVTITKPEFIRRMKEMQMLQGMSMGDFGDFYNVVINTNHPIVASKIKGDAAEATAKYLLDLALLSQGMLKGADLTDFINKSIGKL